LQNILADFHSFLNNKLEGKWEDIRWASDNYFKQALIASLKCFGVDESQVEFISGKDLYEKIRFIGKILWRLENK